MRRFRVLLSLMGVALMGILAAQTPPLTIAQERRQQRRWA